MEALRIGVQFGLVGSCDEQCQPSMEIKSPFLETAKLAFRLLFQQLNGLIEGGRIGQPSVIDERVGSNGKLGFPSLSLESWLCYMQTYAR